MTKPKKSRLKKHKIWLELLAKEPTEFGAIPIKTSVGIIRDTAKVAEKYKFEAMIRGLPKDIADYEPSGKEIQIEKLSDIIEKLTPEQVEMFLVDLRKWIDHGREIKAMKDNPKVVQKFAEKFGCEIQVEENWKMFKKGMHWLDTGKNKRITKIEIQSN